MDHPRRGMAPSSDPGSTTAAPPSPPVPARFTRRALGWSVVGAAVTLLALAGMVRVDHLAKGTARLQLGEWVDVAAPESGRVVEVGVELSQAVGAGQRLATVETASGRTEVTAPEAGRVARVSVARGAEVTKGQPVVAVMASRELPTLYANFPEAFRPDLAPGMKVEFQLEGMPQPMEAVIDHVEDREASRQYANARDAVVVRAHVVDRNYERDGRQRVYQDGMTGHARVKLGTQRLLVSWFPGLRGALP
jgi:multidrug resistance efflux pump